MSCLFFGLRVAVDHPPQGVKKDCNNCPFLVETKGRAGYTAPFFGSPLLQGTDLLHFFWEKKQMSNNIYNGL
jgi:hypothetical protein